MKIACTFPGKIGDLLWALPTVRAISLAKGVSVDLYTSTYCSPLFLFLWSQPFIENVIFPKEYQIQGWTPGIQPYVMPVAEGYDEVYHLGYKEWPSMPLKDAIAQQAKLSWTPAPFVPVYPKFVPPEGYIVVCIVPRAVDLLCDVGDRLVQEGYSVVWIGDLCKELPGGINLTALDFIYTAGVLASARLVVSLPSANAVLSHFIGQNLMVLAFGAEKDPIFRIPDALVIDIPDGLTEHSLVADIVVARLPGVTESRAPCSEDSCEITIGNNVGREVWRSSLCQQFGEELSCFPR